MANEIRIYVLVFLIILNMYNKKGMVKEVNKAAIEYIEV